MSATRREKERMARSLRISGRTNGDETTYLYDTGRTCSNGKEESERRTDQSYCKKQAGRRQHAHMMTLVFLLHTTAVPVNFSTADDGETIRYSSRWQDTDSGNLTVELPILFSGIEISLGKISTRHSSGNVPLERTKPNLVALWGVSLPQ